MNNFPEYSENRSEFDLVVFFVKSKQTHDLQFYVPNSTVEWI